MINPILDITQSELKDKVYVKTNIGGWFFDAFLKLDHSSTLKITEHPVQTGASITDHAYLEPRTLTMEIGMSDAAESYIGGQFSQGWSRSVSAFEVLRQLQSQRIPCQILTRLGLYQNMLAETISAPDDYMTLYGLRVTVSFREIIVATVQTVQVGAAAKPKTSKAPQKTNSTAKGQVNVTPVNKSVLRQMADRFMGVA